MRILLILLRTLGDVVLGGTLIAELKKKYQESEITFAVWPEYAEIVDLNPDVKGLILTKDWEVVLQEASSGKYDRVFCPYQTTHTDTCWHHNPKYMKGHLVDFYARRCGLEITDRRSYFYPKQRDMETVDQFVPLDLSDREVIIIHTTSLVSAKDWNQFGELAEAIKESYPDAQLIQVGGKNDTRAEKATDMRGDLTLSQIGCLISKATLFIGIDSGISYIADAMGCPAICIMGMSTQKTSGPIGPNAHFIEPERPKGCEWSCHTNCKYNNPCIRTITVERVLDKIKEVLESGKEK